MGEIWTTAAHPFLLCQHYQFVSRERCSLAADLLIMPACFPLVWVPGLFWHTQFRLFRSSSTLSSGSHYMWCRCSAQGTRLGLTNGLVWGLQHQRLLDPYCCDKLLADVDSVSFSGFCLCAVFIQTEIPLMGRMAGFSVADTSQTEAGPTRALPCRSL